MRVHTMNSPAPHEKLFALLALQWRRIGGGSLLLSLVIHAALITAAVLLIRTSTRETPVSFLPAGNGAAKAASANLAETVSIKRAARQRESERHRIATINPDPKLFLPNVTSDPTTTNDNLDQLLSSINGSNDGMAGPGKDIASGRSPFSRDSTIPGQAFNAHDWKGRCNTPERLKKLRENGGDPRCELAVSRALEWLKSRQNPDGSWGSRHKGAMTGFALLCYLGRCHTPDDVFYGASVTRGIQWLIETSKKNDHGIFSEKPLENAASYEHGIATYALGETYEFARRGTTTLPGLREAFERGIAIIIDHQLPDGGWGYGDGFCYRRSGALLTRARHENAVVDRSSLAGARARVSW